MGYGIFYFEVIPFSELHVAVGLARIPPSSHTIVQ